MTTLNLRSSRRSALVLTVVLAALPSLSAEKLPEKDLRAAPPKTLNTLRTFPEIKSRAEWESRAQAIREQVLVSCGLWPLPERTPSAEIVLIYPRNQELGGPAADLVAAIRRAGRMPAALDELMSAEDVEGS